MKESVHNLAAKVSIYYDTSVEFHQFLLHLPQKNGFFSIFGVFLSCTGGRR